MVFACCLQGISGFGSAIVSLLVWVAFTSLGVDAGSLQLSIVNEAITSTVASLPLLYLTDAFRTCSFELAATVMIMQVGYCQ